MAFAASVCERVVALDRVVLLAPGDARRHEVLGAAIAVTSGIRPLATIWSLYGIAQVSASAIDLSGDLALVERVEVRCTASRR